MDRIERFSQFIKKFIKRQNLDKIDKGVINRALRREFGPRNVSSRDAQKVVNKLKKKDDIEWMPDAVGDQYKVTLRESKIRKIIREEIRNILTEDKKANDEEYLRKLNNELSGKTVSDVSNALKAPNVLAVRFEDGKSLRFWAQDDELLLKYN